jgi:hypothetical protein
LQSKFPVGRADPMLAASNPLTSVAPVGHGVSANLRAPLEPCGRLTGCVSKPFGPGSKPLFFLEDRGSCNPQSATIFAEGPTGGWPAARAARALSSDLVLSCPLCPGHLRVTRGTAVQVLRRDHLVQDERTAASVPPRRGRGRDRGRRRACGRGRCRCRDCLGWQRSEPLAGPGEIPRRRLLRAGDD